MTKKELLDLLKDVNDDTELFPVSSTYEEDDDSTWGSETQTEIVGVTITDENDVFIILETEEFM